MSSAPWQVMPPLTADELSALRDDIAANGVLVPITVDQHGVVINEHIGNRSPPSWDPVPDDGARVLQRWSDTTSRSG